MVSLRVVSIFLASHLVAGVYADGGSGVAGCKLNRLLRLRAMLRNYQLLAPSKPTAAPVMSMLDSN